MAEMYRTFHRTARSFRLSSRVVVHVLLLLLATPVIVFAQNDDDRAGMVPDEYAQPAELLAEEARRNPGNVAVQIEDSVAAGIATELPLWMHANRWGTFDTAGPQRATSAAVSQHFLLATPDFGGRVSASYHLLGLYRTPADGSPAAELNTGYAALVWGQATLAGGALPLEKGQVYGPLSSGSVVLSRNARPIPRVYFGLDWIDVPLTDGAVEIKGSISHGWLEEDRTISNPWLHEKDAYARLNDPFGWGLSVYRGLVQEVVWAGTRQDGTEQPDSWNDFWRVFRSEEGGEDATLSDQQNALGDTLGMWDQGIMLKRPSWEVTLYHQHFFEGGSGFEMGRREDWEEKLKRLRDGLTGVHVGLPKLPYLDNIVYELLFTKHQSGPGWHNTTGGWDSYYQHGQYRSEWTFRGRMIGPPLIRIEGEGEDVDIVHNRVVANHLGIDGRITEDLRYRLLGTYSSNHGTYRGNTDGANNPNLGQDPYGDDLEKDDIFLDGLGQWSLLAELDLDRNLFGVPSLYGSVAFGADFGDLREDTSALMLAVGWRDVF